MSLDDFDDDDGDGGGGGGVYNHCIVMTMATTDLIFVGTVGPVVL